jgi:hypothetical protein
MIISASPINFKKKKVGKDEGDKKEGDRESLFGNREW